MIATAMALGIGMTSANAARSLEYGVYGLNEQKLGSWKISGEIRAADTLITLKSQITSCGKDVTQIPNRNLFVDKESQTPTNPQICGLNSAISNASDSVNISLNADKTLNKFTGSLLINGKAVRGPFGSGTVKASSKALIRVTTRGRNLSGTLDGTPVYGERQIPQGQNNSQSNSTTITAVVRDSQTQSVLAQQNLYKTTYNLQFTGVPGGVIWDSNSIDFWNISTGTFSINYGSWTNKQGNLFLEFRNGKVFRSEDSGFFDTWLPAVGTSASFISLNKPAVSDLGFNYKIPDFGRNVDLTINGEIFSTAVPEPISLAGTLTALGFGTFFRFKYRRNKQSP